MSDNCCSKCGAPDPYWRIVVQFTGRPMWDDSSRNSYFMEYRNDLCSPCFGLIKQGLVNKVDFSYDQEK